MKFIQELKLQQLYWEHVEVLALIKAKREEHLIALSKVDQGNQFEIIITKWKKYSTNIMNANFF